MSTPRSFGFLAIVFAVVYAVVYVIAVSQNYALFTYHPVPGTISMGVVKSYDGPAMYWYGWMATGAIGAFGACLIACLVPEHLAKRVSSAWSWVVPIGAIFLFAFLLRNYFLH
jgi:hypothetical protein